MIDSGPLIHLAGSRFYQFGSCVHKIGDWPTFLRFVIDRLFIELNYIVDGLWEFWVLAEFPDSSVVPAVDARNAQIGQQGKFGHCRERYSGGYCRVRSDDKARPRPRLLVFSGYSNSNL